MKRPYLIGAIIVSTTMPSGMMQPEITVDQICVPGYSKSVRPSASWTNQIKRDSCAALDPDAKAVWTCVERHELDHRNAIEDGGCPDCPDNLWLQEWPEAKKKDVVENYVHALLCTGKIDLSQVPDYMENWEELYQQIKSDE